MTFEEVLESYDIPMAPSGHRHARPGWIQFDCPFCGFASGKFHMGYRQSGSFANCWNCGGHHLEHVFTAMLHISLSDAKELISQIGIYHREKKQTNTHKLVLPKGVFTNVLKKTHRKYLEERGFNVTNLIKHWHLGSLCENGEPSWSVFIPIYLRGEIVSWTTRYIGTNPKVPRYQAAASVQEAFSAKHLLYGEDYCSYSIIITEGPTDAWKIGPGAVATLGVAYTPAQLARMIRYPIRVVCFDKGAQRQARGLYSQLGAFPGETYNIVLDSEDPGSATKKEIKEIRKVAGL